MIMGYYRWWWWWDAATDTITTTDSSSSGICIVIFPIVVEELLVVVIVGWRGWRGWRRRVRGGGRGDGFLCTPAFFGCVVRASFSFPFDGAVGFFGGRPGFCYHCVLSSTNRLCQSISRDN